MKTLRSILFIVTGALLVVLVVNDFMELLVEYLFNVSDQKLPIEFSPDGWKIKWWMMDHPPAFDLYQILFFGVGFLMMMLGVFDFTPQFLRMGIVGGLFASAILVLAFPNLHYIVQETPAVFMYGQLLAAIGLVPVILQPKNISLIKSVAFYVATILVLTLVIAAVIKTPVTLRFAVFPALGLAALFILQLVTKNKTISS